MSNSFDNVSVPAETNPGPSIQESYDALVAEGLIQDEAAATSGDTQVAQGGAEEAKGDAPAGEDTGTERPSWLPEEFDTVEEFRAAYEAMKNGDGEEEESTDEASTEPTEEERAAADEATKKAGLDLNTVSQEYWANGGLTDKTYEALDKAGYPRELVDVYIEGLVSRSQTTERAVYELAGSQEAYGEMVQYAIDNLTDAQQEAYDREINSGNKTRVMNAVKALKADFEAHRKANESVEPDEIIEPKGGAVKSQAYQNLDDYMEDMNDPRYETSETYRQQVAAKLARSNIM